MTVWILEISLDNGKTWQLEQQNGFYKNEDRAQFRATRRTSWLRSLGPESIYHNAIVCAQEYRSA